MLFRSPRAPDELIEARRSFVIRINRPPIKLLSIVAPAAGVLGTFLFHDPLWALLIPFALLLAGSPAIFRFLARYSPILTAAALLGLIYRLGWDRLSLTLLLSGISLYLFTIPDLSRLSEKWYLINPIYS